MKKHVIQGVRFMFFRKNTYEAVRDDRDVSMESSICTGEKTIGFKNPQTGKIEQSVVVRGAQDIDDFYRTHKLIKTKEFKL